MFWYISLVIESVVIRSDFVIDSERDDRLLLTTECSSNKLRVCCMQDYSDRMMVRFGTRAQAVVS